MSYEEPNKALRGLESSSPNRSLKHIRRDLSNHETCPITTRAHSENITGSIAKGSEKLDATRPHEFSADKSLFRQESLPTRVTVDNSDADETLEEKGELTARNPLVSDGMQAKAERTIGLASE